MAVIACVLVLIPRPAHAYEDRLEVSHGQYRHRMEYKWYYGVDAQLRWWRAVKNSETAREAQQPLPSPLGHALSPVSGHYCAIPAYICQRESRYDPRAQNPVSSASGKYQFLDSTWANYGGFQHAKDAPEWMQDEKAREVWAATGGAAWACC